MWGDIGIMVDVRFYGVAPHWYFRPFMAWLIACPSHHAGVFGLIFFFFVLFYQPVLHGISEQNSYNKRILLIFFRKFHRVSIFSNLYFNYELNLYHQFTYFVFIWSCLYACSFLPYGRFYNRLGGNIGMLLSYLYIFCYLGFPVFRRLFILELFLYTFYSKVKFLKNLS
jgi:hypothetical protein